MNKLTPLAAAAVALISLSVTASPVDSSDGESSMRLKDAENRIIQMNDELPARTKETARFAFRDTNNENRSNGAGGKVSARTIETARFA